MLKNGMKVINKKGLHYIVEDGDTLLQFKPWLGDSFSFLYDFIMKRYIFPKKFDGDINKHYEILNQELKAVHGKHVLELATGSGNAVKFLPNDNQYTGTDISAGLLKKDAKRFRSSGFKDACLYVSRADDLPFEDNLFDMVLCILSLNFFSDVKKVLKEVKRVSSPDAVFICCVPVPERNNVQSKIRGKLFTEAALTGICKEHGFSYSTIPVEHGTLLYFRSIIKKSSPPRQPIGKLS